MSPEEETALRAQEAMLREALAHIQSVLSEAPHSEDCGPDDDEPWCECLIEPLSNHVAGSLIDGAAASEKWLAEHDERLVVPWIKGIDEQLETLRSGAEGPALFMGELAAHDARVRAEAAALVRKYLAYNSQRAVSWHEVQDCAEAIIRGEKP